MKELGRKLAKRIKGAAKYVKSDKLGILVCALLGVLSICQLSRLGANIALANADCIDWGLSFPRDGETPIGNSDAEMLKSLNAFFVGDTSKKIVCLTFDAGYENGYTTSILDTLKDKKVPAAFFLVGNYVSDNPQLVNRMSAEGHLICSHTMNHPDITKLSEAELREELVNLETLVAEKTDAELTRFFRPPSGKYSERSLDIVRSSGYTTVLWSLAYADWDNDRQPTAETAYEKLLPRMHNGAIILLHATGKTNSEILGSLIDRIREAGYEFAPLTELAVQ